MQAAKRKKIIDIIVNCVVTCIMIVVFVMSILVISGSNKGYISFFGTSTAAVKSESMAGDQVADYDASPYHVGSFKKGDSVTIKILSADEKRELKVGDVISFYDPSIGGNKLNTHRIVQIVNNTDGTRAGYKTKGDHPRATEDDFVRYFDEIVGAVTKVNVGGGRFTLFFESTAGFLVCVILPALLVIGYFVWSLIKSYRDMKRKNTVSDEKERIRREILKEMGIDPDSEAGRAMLVKAAEGETEQPVLQADQTSLQEQTTPTSSSDVMAQETVQTESETGKPNKKTRTKHVKQTDANKQVALADDLQQPQQTEDHKE